MAHKKHTRPIRGERANSTGMGQASGFAGRERNFTASDTLSKEVRCMVQIAVRADELQREYEAMHPGVKKRPSYDDFLDRAAEQLDEAGFDD